MSDPIAPSGRTTAPVFVLGCPRSGTTLLYDMLLSAGGFAVYLAESNVFNLLALRFGDLAARRNRENLLGVWLGSKLFRATGLNRQLIEQKILDECHNPGDFLCIVMSEIARGQGMQRWAENSPECLLHLPLIKQLIPDALVIHILRDGRDVATSLEKVRYVHPFPWEERQNLIGSGIYWEWIVERGRAHGQRMGKDYLEVRFEDLIASPQATLNQVGRFIDHELDYNRIRQVAYGSVAKPNSSFKTESLGSGFNPVGRWRKAFSSEQLVRFERMMGETLRELGYTPETARPGKDMNPQMKAARFVYRSYFSGKLWFKRNALIRKLRPALTSAEIDATVLAEDHPPQIRSTLSRSS
jgi:Sulfotransferase family